MLQQAGQRRGALMESTAEFTKWLKTEFSNPCVPWGMHCRNWWAFL